MKKILFIISACLLFGNFLFSQRSIELQNATIVDFNGDTIKHTKLSPGIIGFDTIKYSQEIVDKNTVFINKTNKDCEIEFRCYLSDSSGISLGYSFYVGKKSKQETSLRLNLAEKPATIIFRDKDSVINLQRRFVPGDTIIITKKHLKIALKSKKTKPGNSKNNNLAIGRILLEDSKQSWKKYHTLPVKTGIATILNPIYWWEENCEYPDDDEGAEDDD